MTDLARNRAVWTALCSLVFAAATASMAQEKGGGDVTGPYELVPNWPQNLCGPGYQVGSTGGIFAESPDRVYIFQRGCLPELTDGTWGELASLVPSRNASSWDLSPKGPEPPPAVGQRALHRRPEREEDRLLGAAQPHVRQAP